MNTTIRYLFLFPVIVSFKAAAHQPVDDLDCISCHEEILNQPSVHEAVNAGCDNCHFPVKETHPVEGQKSFQLVENLPSLCFMCHEEYTKEYKHYPAAEGECLICHSPHSSKNKFLIAGQKKDLCVQCHEISTDNQKSIHAPVENWNCVACHDPHQSDHMYFLKAARPELCFNCHEDLKAEGSFSYQHPPFLDDCANCHQSHSSEQDYLLNEKTPDICYMCHTDPVNEHTISQHSILKSPNNCANCHTPHASNIAYNLISEEKELCLGCHNKKIESKAKSYANIAALLTPENRVHQAIELGGCIVCHQPHASEYVALVIAAFPALNYTKGDPANYELCFNCHDPEIIQNETDSLSTQFRNGAENLHFVHSGDQKSRNCKLCHNMHGSENKHILETKVTYGQWEMPVEYSELSNGGSCKSGCHEKKSYFR